MPQSNAIESVLSIYDYTHFYAALCMDDIPLIKLYDAKMGYLYPTGNITTDIVHQSESYCMFLALSQIVCAIPENAFTRFQLHIRCNNCTTAESYMDVINSINPNNDICFQHVDDCQTYDAFLHMVYAECFL